MPSDRRSGAGVSACADVATAKANEATPINLIIAFPPVLNSDPCRQAADEAVSSAQEAQFIVTSHQ